jgi:hypothetical protein
MILGFLVLAEKIAAENRNIKSLSETDLKEMKKMFAGIEDPYFYLYIVMSLILCLYYKMSFINSLRIKYLANINKEDHGNDFFVYHSRL